MAKPALDSRRSPVLFECIHAIADQEPRSIVQLLVARLLRDGHGKIVRIDLREVEHKAPKIMCRSDHRIAHHFLAAIAYSFECVETYRTPFATHAMLSTPSPITILPRTFVFLPAS